MRDIKFRGIKKGTKGEWIYGGYFSNTDEEGLEHFIFTIYYGGNPIYDHTIGQFTGLKDKNGLDIYEGDIINFRANYTDKPCGYFDGVVEITPWKLIITVNGLEYDAEEECEGLDYNSQVVGNIYENNLDRL